MLVTMIPSFIITSAFAESALLATRDRFDTKHLKLVDCARQVRACPHVNAMKSRVPRFWSVLAVDGFRHFD